MLKEKAKLFAEKLVIRCFMTGGGWLMDEFKKRNLIKFYKICSKGVKVGEGICSKRKEKLMEMISSNDPKDVFNTDEIAILQICA